MVTADVDVDVVVVKVVVVVVVVEVVVVVGGVVLFFARVARSLHKLHMHVNM